MMAPPFTHAPIWATPSARVVAQLNPVAKRTMGKTGSTAQGPRRAGFGVGEAAHAEAHAGSGSAENSPPISHSEPMPRCAAISAMDGSDRGAAALSALPTISLARASELRVWFPSVLRAKVPARAFPPETSGACFQHVPALSGASFNRSTMLAATAPTDCQSSCKVVCV